MQPPTVSEDIPKEIHDLGPVAVTVFRRWRELLREKHLWEDADVQRFIDAWHTNPM